MNVEQRKDCKFFITLSMGFCLMVAGMIIPPVGVISSSVLWGSSFFLILSAGIIGLDIPAILHELNEMKKIKVENNQEGEQ